MIWRLILTILALIGGLVAGYFLVFLLVFVVARIQDCLKNCNFEVWYFNLAVAAPLLILLLLDAREYLRTSVANRPKLSRFLSSDWIARRAFPAGMALSFVLFQPMATDVISRMIARHF